MQTPKVSKIGGRAMPHCELHSVKAEPEVIPILSQELDLLDGHIDDVVAFVVKHAKIEEK